MTTSNIREIGPRLIDLGYHTCAIPLGSKGPRKKDWNKRSRTKEECRAAPASFGVGILCGVGSVPVHALDVDSYDEEVSKEFESWVEEHFGFEYTLYKRIGEAPKYALLFRMEEAGAKKETTPRFIKDGVKAQLEVIGAGGQLCAYHIHRDTHKPYIWPEIPLIETQAEELPLLTSEQVQQALTAFVEIVERRGFEIDTKEKSFDINTFDADDWEPAPLVLRKLTIEEAEEYLMGSGLSNVDRDSWYKAGMALHHHFEGSDEALRLWDKWSASAPNYKGLDDCAKTWNSFHDDKSKPVTIGSIIAAYQKNNKDNERQMYVLNIAKRLIRSLGSYLKRRRGDKAVCYFFESPHWVKAPIDVAESVLSERIEDEYKRFVQDAPTPEQLKSRAKFYAAFEKNPVRYVREITQSFFLFGGEGAFVRDEDFDTNTRYFGVANGDIDLETGELLAPDASRMVSKFSPAVFDQKAKCPLWEKTLLECLVDENVVDYLQRFMGYIALGDPKENKLAFFHGYGSNGKSTLTSVLLEVFGPYGVAMQPETLVSLGDKRSSSSTGLSPEVVKLKGARLALAEELTEGAKVKSEMLKRLAGTERIAAREMYQSPIEFNPTHTVIVCTNHLPEIADDSDGAWRRIVLIEFPRSFDKDPNYTKDENLKDKLLKEAPGILNWILEGVRKYKKYGLATPAALKQAVNKWRGEEDVVGTWIEDCLESAEKDYKVPMREVYASFKIWAAESGQTKQSSQWLTRRLKERGYTIKAGAHRYSYLYGAKLIEDKEDLW